MKLPKFLKKTRSLDSTVVSLAVSSSPRPLPTALSGLLKQYHETSVEFSQPSTSHAASSEITAASPKSLKLNEIICSSLRRADAVGASSRRHASPEITAVSAHSLDQNSLPSFRVVGRSGRHDRIAAVSSTSVNQKDEICFSSSGAITTEELEQIFRMFDANGDGKISADDLRNVLQSLGDSATDEEATLMVKEVDADGDGFIDLQEFIKLHTREVDLTGEIATSDELRAVFRMFDLDRNGYITPEELSRVLRSLGEKECTMDDCRKMIRGVDRNGDGLVDFEEFKSMMA